MRAFLVLLMAICLIFSGCAGSSSSAATTPPPSLGTGPDADGGSIEGLVTDSELQPLEGALIVIKDISQAMTDGQGRFLLQQIPPGAQRVFVQSLGYNSAARNVTVVAGETVELVFHLEALPLEGPRQETKQLAGHICGQFHAGGSIINLGNLACGGQGSIFVPFQVKGGLSALLAEMTWVKNSGFTSNELDLRIWQGGARSGAFSCTHCYGAVKGTSPLRLELTGPFAGLKDVAPDQTANFDNTIYVPADRSNPTGVNIVLDQRTTIYDTMFYGGPMPPGYSAVPDR